MRTKLTQAHAPLITINTDINDQKYPLWSVYSYSIHRMTLGKQLMAFLEWQPCQLLYCLVTISVLVVYYNQCLGAAHPKCCAPQMLFEIFFFSVCCAKMLKKRTIFTVFQHFSIDFSLFMLIYYENGWKKVFRPAFGWAQHPKVGRNTQQSRVVWQLWPGQLNNW